MPRTDPDAPTISVHSRYGTVLGATVTLTRHTPDADRYSAACDGCLDIYTNPSTGERSAGLNRARDWAQAHAATCRALPQPAQAP